MRLPALFFTLACSLMACTGSPRFLLMGEVHDHAGVHRLRLAELQAMVEAGWRPAIAMEQFDTSSQARLADAQARCGLDATCIIDAAGGRSGWDWAFYAPVIVLAQRHGLPLLAANLSRDAAMTIARGQKLEGKDGERLARYPEAPAEVLAGQIEAVRRGHCDLLPAKLLPGMARAQIARDQMMADVVLEAGRDAVLLAGNGHLRKDIGVPHWLPPGAFESIAYVEAPSPAGHYDREYLLPPEPREDPCAALAASQSSAR